MSSILRTSKFVRYFAGFARNLTINVKDINSTAIQHNHYLCSNSAYGFSTSIASFKPNEANLDRSLQRIDQDVRRSGRISKRDIEEILEEIRHNRSANSSQSLLVIRCCGNLVPEEQPEVRTRLVKEIWSTLENLNVQMDVSHYNALLRVYLENEHKFLPTEFLADMESKGIEPNRVTYQRLILQYCQEGDIEGATRILEFMREKQLPVNENVFNALIVGHSQVGDMESAKDILSVMGQAGLEPSADTYTALMCGYAKKGDIEAIHSLIETCENKEIHLLDKDFMDIIYTLAVNGHKDNIDSILKCVKKSFGYNHDAINVILRLINKGHEDVGLTIMKTMVLPEKVDESSTNNLGSFFIRQLIKANRPFEYVMKIVRQLEDEGINKKAFTVAIENAFLHGNMDTIVGILNEMKKTGEPIRHHYLWPLICRMGRTKDDEKIIDVLKLYMQFDLIPNGETLRDYVYDNLQEKNPHLALQLIRSAGLSEALCASTLVMNLLTKFKIKEAADVAASYKAYYSPYMIKRLLNSSLVKTGDIDSYINIVHVINGNMERREVVTGALKSEEDVDEVASNKDQQSLDKDFSTGTILVDLTYMSPKLWKSLLEPVLKGLIEKGLGITNRHAELIQEKLVDSITPELSELLSTLSSGELDPLPLNQQNRNKITTNDQIQLEGLIKALEKKGEQPNGLKRQLITVYCRNREIEKLEALMEKLKNENFSFSSGANAQILELYVHFEKLDKAMDMYKEIQGTPDFAIDDFKILRLVDLLVKKDRFDEAVKILDKQPSQRKLEDRSFAYNSICWRLLNHLAETKNVENLKLIFDKLVANNFIEINNVLLGPLIKVHLLRDDLDSAMKEFESCCVQHHVTPWKTELTCMLIQKEDATNLQKLTDLSTKVHGEVNSLYDLVFAFVECGRVRQARKILETPGLRSRPHRINSACERYLQEGMATPLEGLIEATKDLSYIDQTDIYYNLLSHYCNANETEKALGLWTKMQEEDLAPTKEFLTKLGTYLQCKELPVPFVIPESTIKKASFKGAENESSDTFSVRDFHKALRLGNVDNALEIRKQLGKQRPFSINENSLLIEALLKHDRFKETIDILFELLDKGVHPLPRIFRFCLNKLAVKGDFKTLEKIGDAINEDVKKAISFDNRFCHAYICAGKSDEFLDKLYKLILKAQDDELNHLERSFPRGGASGILENVPELLNKYEQIANEYARRGIIGPLNVLWMHHFINENHEAAGEIWSKHLCKSQRVLFQRILDTASKTNNIGLVERLENKIRETNPQEPVLGKIFSCKLDILTAQEKYNEALEYLRTALDDVCLEHFNRSSLTRLSNGAQSKNIPFPYNIPKRKAKNSTTSSSDDEGEPETGKQN